MQHREGHAHQAIRTPSFRRRALMGAGLGAWQAPALVLSKPRPVRISKGYGLLYLPLLVMEKQRLFERHAAQLGVRDVSVVEFVDFLYRVGTIKAKPRTWNEMFVPELGKFSAA